jgi:hypothetical protein
MAPNPGVRGTGEDHSAGGDGVDAAVLGGDRRPRFCSHSDEELPDEVLELGWGELERVGPGVKAGYDVHVVGEAESLEVEGYERLDGFHVERVG